MTELMTSLVLLAYGTAALVGLHLVASRLLHLADLLVQRNGRPLGMGRGPLLPAAVVADLMLLLAGLFLLLQGVVIGVWTFA